MIWSFSDSRCFSQCQRQWYFDTVVANGVAKNPARREAYLLSKLQTISAWRGQIVDDVISAILIPAWNSGGRPTLRYCLGKARDLYERQLTFAMAQRLWEPGVKPSQVKNGFAAFFALEYGPGVTDDELEQAWADIEQSLINFFAMTSLIAELTAGTYRVAQRALWFKLNGHSVKAIPDVVVFHKDGPPLIVDWKVHALGIRDYWLQLVTYAIALSRSDPHSDFPDTARGFAATDIHLTEVQLLKNELRRHLFTDADVDDVEEQIAGSATRMTLALDGKKFDGLCPADFPPARSPEICQTCKYRKVCWEGAQ